ncbi:hypothetical protein COLO4_30314 [Corchorus olitorius]|uniref:Uncharacterized protein n=1 Tax=Corchorus olitorius TaxID=93759 RepID=A0A1R3H942_9ROSI|nr:hypothetical protein COLO4_30314 [Corchorus olitorius]
MKHTSKGEIEDGLARSIPREVHFSESNTKKEKPKEASQ